MGRLRRFLWPLGGLALALGITAAAVAWWHHTSRPEYRLHKGQEAARRGDAASAEHYALLLEAGGFKDHARLVRGEVLFLEGKHFLDSGRTDAANLPLRQALAELNKIQDQGDLRVDAAVLLGQCLLYLKEALAAERAFLFVLDHRPDQIDAHRGLAALYFDQGALSKAIPHVQDVARLDPRDGRPLRMLGHIYLHLDRYAEAATAFREALDRELGTEFAEDAREQLAECHIKRNAYPEALQALDNCKPAPPQKPHLLALRAQCLLHDHPAEARKLLEEAAAASPSSVEVLTLRARLHWEAQEAGAAAAFLEQALAIDPHDYAARYLLAQAYQALGRTADAEEQRRQAEQTKDLLKEMGERAEEADAKPWDAPLRRRLAELCRQLGRPEDAERWAAAAKACGGD